MPGMREMMPSGPELNNIGLFSKENIEDNKENNKENARLKVARELQVMPHMIHLHEDGKYYYGKGDANDISVEEFKDLYKSERGERYK